ncbi:hypothetical protein IIC44_03180 [Patescibacteria group bacterium]|nr:hypothetical protein [Patescibacteria group bacterium]
MLIEEVMVLFDLDDYCKFKASDISDFWRYGREIEFDEKKLINLNDYVYSAFLLGKEDLISPEAVEKYIAYSSSAPYYGCKKKSHQLLPHTTAYSFGTLNILDAMGYKATEKVFSSMEFDTSKIIRPKSGLPHWPAKWAHHTWRVSHWIGGGPAILLNILRNAGICIRVKPFFWPTLLFLFQGVFVIFIFYSSS